MATMPVNGVGSNPPVPDFESVYNGKVAKQQLTFAAAGFVIADTSAHDPSTDSGAGFTLADCTLLPGDKVIWIKNGTNQSITFKVCASPDSNSANLVTFTGSKVLAAGAVGFLDVADVAQLAHPYPCIGISATAGVSPTGGGAVTAFIFAKSV